MVGFYRGISYLFYPGSMAMFGLGIVHLTEPVTLRVWVLFSCGMVIFPLLALALFMKLGKVSDIFIYRRDQRHGLYALGVIFSVLSTLFIFQEGAMNAMIWSACNALVILLLFVINYIGYKASAHMAGVSGLLAWVLCLPTDELLVSLVIILAVLVYVARRGLSAHSHFELILGFCLGLFVTFAIACLLFTYHGISCSFI
ncbi:MAG: hypothetical protein RIT07_456 [Bacteroidota bacterium]|jgi:hypothetical protein